MFENNETDESGIGEKIGARKKLMYSARIAHREGFDPTTWRNHPEIQKVCSRHGLDPDILNHIVAWVWTFGRR